MTIMYKPASKTTILHHRQLPIALASLFISFLLLVGLGQWLPSVAAYLVPPVVDDQTFSVLENSAAGTIVGTVVATDALTYTIIAGNELGAFAINSGNGLLTVADGTQIDYETTPVFNLTVQVANNEGTDTGVMTINVINVNDAPVMEDQTFAVPENSPNGTAVGTLVATDPDGNPLTYAILFGNTGGTFALHTTSGLLTVANNTLLDFETNPVFTLFVMVSDGGLMDTAIITINVLDANDPPTAVADAYTLAENTTLNVAAPGILANDSDQEGDPLTAMLDTLPANGALTLNANGSFSYTPNAGYNGSDSFTYFANDGSANSPLAATVTLTITGVNDPPLTGDDAYTTAINTPLAVPAPGVLANDADPENDPLTAVLDTPAANGTVNLASSGAFVYTPTLNFVGVDTFAYHAEDSAPLASAVTWVTITVTNQAPTAVDDLYTTPEDTPLSITAPGVLANDSDPEGGALTAVLNSGPSNGALSLTSNGAFVYTPTLNFAGTDSFTYHAQDEEPLASNVATVTITVTNQNDPPVANDATFNVDENSANGTAVGTVTATDLDGDPLTFTITGGNTNNAFAIGSSSGQITVNNSAALNFETTPIFVLTVRVQDPGGLNDTAAITINLNDVNEAPTAFDDAFTIPENSANGSSVGTVTATDPDAGDTLTYGIMAGNTGSTFAINGGTGEITVNDNTLLDFETNPTFVLTVRVTDTGGLADDAQITINVTNVNEFPPDINPQTFAVAEDAANGTIVGTVVVTDADGLDTFTFVILGGDPNGVFSITNAGVIAVADNSTLDYETTPSYGLNVQVADSGNLTDTAVMTINILDANDPPLITDNDLTVTPGSVQETETITLTGVFIDQDGGDAHTITILWDDGTSDVLNLIAGVTSFTATHTYQDDPPGLPDDYLIDVTVADAVTSASANATATVTNAAPTLGSIMANPAVLDEGQAITLTGTFTEVSPLDSFTLLVDWGDGAVESFNYAAGSNNFQETHTYQDNYNPATILVTITDDDDGSDVGGTAVTVNNLPPTADAGPDLIVLDGSAANFNGTANDPGAGDTHTFDWAFGDGSGTSGTLTPSHIYPGVGVYTATLTVTDDDGASALDTARVNVISPSDLVGQKTVSGSFTEGGAVLYTIVLSNTGATAQLDNPGDEFVDMLPAELLLTNAQISSGGGTLGVITATNTVTWSGAIPAGGSIILELTATILPGFRGQTVSNQGQIFYDADGNGDNEANTYTDDPTQPGTFDPTTFTIQELYFVHLPVILHTYATAPDLVVTSMSASSNLIQVTIENQGTAVTPNGFWVDFYINPSPPPTGANQLWYDLASEGIAWGVTALLAPGQSLTLVYSTAPGAPNQYFVAEESLYSGTLPAGTLVYVQVDSAREGVAYGGILETHEITGGPYNNIMSGTAVAP